MKSYRINCVDAQDKLVATHDIMFADDLAALRRATELCAHYGVEVWDGHRRVIWMHKGGETRFESIRDALAPPNAKSAQKQIDAGKTARAC